MTDPDRLSLRIVAGAMRSCIDAHGAITRQHTGSAAKRVVTALRAAGADLPRTAAPTGAKARQGQSGRRPPRRQTEKGGHDRSAL